MSTTVEERISESPEAPVSVPSISDPVRDVLREAKGLIAAGWMQMSGTRVGTRVGKHPGHCVVSAVGRTTPYDDDLFEEALDRLRAAAGTQALPPWNDDPSRTHAEVVDLFDRALSGMQ